MKPSWDDAPEWANYLAQDMNGGWRWYKELPHALPGLCLWTSDFTSQFATISKNWKDTLEQRPKQQQMTWISIEDELPPIGELVWVIEYDGSVQLAERYNSQTWVVIYTKLWQSNGRIRGGTVIDDINPKYWHSLPELPKT